MQLWNGVEAARLLGRRASAGPLGSIVKLQLAETVKAVYGYCLDLEGPGALLVDAYTDHRPDVVTPLAAGIPVRPTCGPSRNSNEGGTSEVLKGVLAERVLQLPAETRDRPRPTVESNLRS